MQINAQHTVVIIFQHVEIFFTLLDEYSTSARNSIGFKISTFESVVLSYTEQTIEDNAGKQRIRKALSIANLQSCGLLSFIDDSRGVFSLQVGLIQTIQCLDSKRIRELGQPDLDIIYAQIKSSYDYFIPLGRAYDRGNKEFKEHLLAFMDTLQDVLGKIDHNVRALEGSSKRLSEILDSHDFNKMLATDQIRSALDEIIEISNRNIMPTLTFLNKKAMASDASAMFLLYKIRESFEKTSFYSEHANISAIEMKLLSYSESISSIRRRLYRYVEMSRDQRNLYNAIENRFNEMKDKIHKRMDSRLTGKQLPYDDPIYASSSILIGINNWSRSKLTGSLFEQPDEGVFNLMQEYIRTKLNNADAIATKKRMPTKRGKSTSETIKTRRRVASIKAAMESFEIKNTVSDLYLSVHHHLQKEMEGYALRDIYDALHFIKGNLPRKQTLVSGKIDYKNKSLMYMKKRIEVSAP